MYIRLSSPLETMTYCFEEKELGETMKSNRRSMKKSAVFSFSLLISIFILSSAQAAWVPLTGEPVSLSCIPAGGLVVGDKLFSEFNLDQIITTGGVIAPTADTLFVQGGKDDATGYIGLKFMLAWDVGSGQMINANIDYKVSILSTHELMYIDGAWSILTLTGATGTGLVSVSEVLYDGPLPFGALLANLSTAWQVGSTYDDIREFANFAQIKQVWVNNGISVTGGLSGTAKLNEVFQMYTQIPEPATILLLGLGALALVRKRRQ